MADKEEHGHDGCSSFLAVVVLLVLVGCIFLNSPGAAVLAFIVDGFNLSLDVGQFWTFSIIISILTYILLKIFNNEHNSIYIKLCFIVTLIYLVAYFGFHSVRALQHWRYLVPS